MRRTNAHSYRRTVRNIIGWLLISVMIVGPAAVLAMLSPLFPEVTVAVLFRWLEDAVFWLLEFITGLICLAIVGAVLYFNFRRGASPQQFDVRCRGQRKDGERCSRDGLERYKWYCDTHKWQGEDGEVIWYDD